MKTFNLFYVCGMPAEICGDSAGMHASEVAGRLFNSIGFLSISHMRQAFLTWAEQAMPGDCWKNTVAVVVCAREVSDAE